MTVNVANLCEYQCPKCNKYYSGRLYLKVHFKTCNHVAYRKGDLNKYLVKIVAHKCHFCSKNILCDMSTILSHVQYYHSIPTCKAYCQKANIRLEHKEANLKKGFEPCHTREKVVPKVSRKIGNLCKFSCLQCKFSCGTWTTMAKHINKTEHGSGSSPSKYATSIVLHRCLLCDEMVLCDYVLVLRHLKRHKMTMPQYKVKNDILPNYDSLEKQYILEYESITNEVPAMEALHKTTLKPNSLPDKQTTGHVGSISIFKCPHCCKSDMSYSALMAHCKNIHKMKHIPYDKNDVVEARYHKCQICAKIILCDNYFLARHVRTCSKGTFPQYIEKHVVKNGFKVIPTFQAFKSNIEYANANKTAVINTS